MTPVTPYGQVVEFNRDILDIEVRPLGMQEEEEFGLSMVQLKEEVDEVIQAYEDKDFIDLIDGLHDLQYFLLGIMYKIGLSEDAHNQIFSAIHQANMGKMKGKKHTRLGFGDSADAVKPAGWLAPEAAIARILEQE